MFSEIRSAVTTFGLASLWAKYFCCSFLFYLWLSNMIVDYVYSVLNDMLVCCFQFLYGSARVLNLPLFPQACELAFAECCGPVKGYIVEQDVLLLLILFFFLNLWIELILTYTLFFWCIFKSVAKFHPICNPWLEGGWGKCVSTLSLRLLLVRVAYIHLTLILHLVHVILSVAQV